VIKQKQIALAGSAIDSEILTYIDTEYNLKTTQGQARKAKESAVAFRKDESSDQIVVYGQDMETDLPQEIHLSSEELIEVAAPLIEEIAASSQAFLRSASTEAAADVYQNGVYIVGGGANISGIGDYFYEALSVPVHTIDNPDLATVYGLQNVRARHKNFNRVSLESGTKA